MNENLFFNLNIKILKIKMEKDWENYVYSKLNLDNDNCYNIIKFNCNYKEIINELLSFIATFRQSKFIFKLDLDNIKYNPDKRTFTLINLKNAKFKLSELSDDEYYFNFISLYFSICKKKCNLNVINYLQTQIINYIPIKELHNFHLITNPLNVQVL